ncbi:hypothetical protein ACFLXQ_07670 [Chloroflexota bacterium]
MPPPNNPLYSGYQPLRAAKEAVKSFIRQLDPQFDQVGLVSYSTDMPAAGRVELRCKRFRTANDCFMGTNPISYTDVLETLETLPPWGSTNMAGGMLRGLEALGIDADGAAGFDNSCGTATDHCSRGGAARRVMVVMSDGIANKDPGGLCDNAANAGLWPPTNHMTSGTGWEEAQATDCVMYYGQIAANNNVTIYTIGLGNGVDVDLMTAVAELPGSNGEYFAAVSPAQLNGIFSAILQSVSVRLIE